MRKNLKRDSQDRKACTKSRPYDPLLVEGRVEDGDEEVGEMGGAFIHLTDGEGAEVCAATATYDARTRQPMYESHGGGTNGGAPMHELRQTC